MNDVRGFEMHSILTFKSPGKYIKRPIKTRKLHCNCQTINSNDIDMYICNQIQNPVNAYEACGFSQTMFTDFKKVYPKTSNNQEIIIKFVDEGAAPNLSVFPINQANQKGIYRKDQGNGGMYDNDFSCDSDTVIYGCQQTQQFISMTGKQYKCNPWMLGQWMYHYSILGVDIESYKLELRCYCPLTQSQCQFKEFKFSKQNGKVEDINKQDYFNAGMRIFTGNSFKYTFQVEVLNQENYKAFFNAEIIVCGLEQLTFSPVILNIAKQEGQSDKTIFIDASTLSGYLTKDLTNSDAQCFDNTMYGLYQDQLGTQTFSSSIIRIDQTSTQVDFAYNLIVNDLSPFAKQQFYIVAKSLGGVSAYIEVNLEVCASNSISVINSPYVLDLMQGQGIITISQSTIQSWVTDNSQSGSLCQLQKAGLYKDNTGTTPNDQTFISEDTGVSPVLQTLYPILIDTSSYQSETKVYIVYTQIGGNTYSREIVIRICNPYTSITVNPPSSSSANLFVYQQQVGVFQTITASTVQQWFNVNSFQSTSCPFTLMQICIDSNCATPQNDNIIKVDQTGIQSNNFLPIEINIDQPFSQRLVYYQVKAPTAYSNNAVVYIETSYLIKVEVCGFNQIQVIQPVTNILQYKTASGQGSINTLTIFQQISPNCNIISYSLYQDQGGLNPWSLSVVSLQNNLGVWSIQYDYSQQFQQQSLFIKATASSSQEIFAELIYEVCGSATPNIQSTVLHYIYNVQDIIHKERISIAKPFSAQCLTQFTGQIETFDGVNYYPYIDNDVTIQLVTPIDQGFQDISINLKIKQPKRKFYARIDDGTGNIIRQAFEIEFCGNQLVSVSSQASNPLVLNYNWKSGVDMKQTIKDIDNWFISSYSICKLTLFGFQNQDGTPYTDQTFQIESLDIKISTEKNYHKTVNLVCQTEGGSTAKIQIQLNICGEESVEIKNTTHQKYVFPRYSGINHQHEIISDVSQFFESSDPNCPINGYQLMTIQGDDYSNYTNYKGSNIILTKDNEILVSTSFPTYDLNTFIQGFTQKNTIGSFIQLEIRICGDESVTTKQLNPININFDMHSNEIRYPEKILLKKFKSSSIDCPVTKYSISQNQSLGEQQINKNIYIESLTQDLVINLQNQYRSQTNKILNFYIIAQTDSDQFNYLQVVLNKFDCLSAFVQIRKDTYIQRNFDSKTKSLVITQIEYMDEFQTNEPRRCPIKSYLLALKKDTNKLKTDIFKFIYIDEKTNEIWFDIDKLRINVRQKFVFYIAAQNEAQTTAFLPVILNNTSTEKAVFNFTDQFNQRSFLNRTFKIQNETDQNQIKQIVKIPLITKQNISTQKQDKKSITISLKNVDYRGMTTLVFSDPMHDENQGFNISSVNTQTVSIKVISAETQRSLNITWKAISLKHRHLKLFIQFANPLHVSSKENELQAKDRIILEVLDLKLFKSGTSSSGLRFIRRGNEFARAHAKKQLKNNIPSIRLKDNVEIVQDGINGIVIAQFTLSLLIQVGLSMILGTFNILQVVCFQSMINLNYPANAQLLQSQITAILNLDILDPSLILDRLYNFQSDEALMDECSFNDEYRKYDILNQIKNLDFETFNPILNIGGLFTVICAVIAQLLVIGFLKIVMKYLKHLKSKNEFEGGAPSNERYVKRMLKKIGRFERKARYRLQWRTPLMLIHESIIQITMSIFLFMQKPFQLVNENLSDAFTDVSSYLFLGVYTVAITAQLILYIRIIFIDERVLSNPVILRKYGFIYEDIRYKSKTSKLINVFFVSRRMLVCFISLYLYNYVQFQIIFIIFQNYFSMAYITFARPFITKRINNKEIFNEFLILMISYNIILFSDFANDDDFRYDVAGWLFIGLISFIIVFNVQMVLRGHFHKFKLVLRKYCKVLKLKCNCNSKKSRKKRKKLFDAIGECKQSSDGLQFGGLEFFRPREAGPHLTFTRFTDSEQSLQNYEEALKQIICKVFEARRGYAVLQAQLACVRQGFRMDLLNNLYDQEKARLVHEFKALGYFSRNADQFMSDEYERYLLGEERKKKPLSFDVFKEVFRSELDQRFQSFVEYSLQNERMCDLTYQSGSFEEFACTLRMDYILRNMIDAFSCIKPKEMKKDPCLYGFFKIEYLDELALEEERQLLSLTDAQISKLAHLNEISAESMQSLNFKHAMRLTAEERKEFFLDQINDGFDSNIQTEIQIHGFYTILVDYYSMLLYNIQKQQDVDIKSLEREGLRNGGINDLRVKIFIALRKFIFDDCVITITRKKEESEAEIQDELGPDLQRAALALKELVPVRRISSNKSITFRNKNHQCEKRE